MIAQTNLYLLHLSALPDLQILWINSDANKLNKMKYQRQDTKQIDITAQWKPYLRWEDCNLTARQALVQVLSANQSHGFCKY